MKRLIKRKKITVTTKGFIVPLASRGPIEDPMILDMDRIQQLIMGGYSVIEHLKDGKQVRLDVTNFDKENGDVNNPSMMVSFEPVRKPGYHNDRLVQTIPATATVQDLVKKPVEGVSTVPVTKMVPVKKKKKDKFNIPANKSNVSGPERIELK